MGPRDDVVPHDAVQPPELLTGSEPVFSGALAPGQQASVVVALVIGVDGAVTDARIQESAGAELDALALEVAQKLAFRPAQRNGVMVAVRILHELVFEAPEPSAAATSTTLPSFAAPLSVDLPAKTPRAPTEPNLGPGSVSAAPADASEPQAREIIVRGVSQAELLRRSAYPVEVVELERAKRHSADLGDTLTRTTSVMVQREGALGSPGRYSMAGLSGDRVRFFLDGVPLELSGYAFGVANVPVNSLERVEVYQGVVPVRFGADALGGAVNLVTDENVRGDQASASYQFGSFDTHRLTLSARRYDAPSGLFVRLSGFYDFAENDYPVDVDVFDDRGKLTPAEVRRFHDAYRGQGARLSVGVVGRPFADRLSLTGFWADYDREVQSNPLMTVPYGEVTFGRRTFGGNARYTKQLATRVRLEATLGYARRETRYRDLSTCSYDWYGRCFLQRVTPGEVSGLPVDRTVNEDAFYGRLLSTIALTEEHSVRLAFVPTLVRRTGSDEALNEGVYDPLSAKRSSDSGVLGLEYEANVFERRVSNVAFAKAYEQRALSRAKLPTGNFETTSEKTLIFGGGDSLRVTLSGPLLAKGSYEYAARLPSSDERFGDGAFIEENIEIEPERSHNVNLGLFVEDARTEVGSFRGGVNGSVRRVHDYVVLQNKGDHSQYVNVDRVNARGLDAGVGFSVPGDVAGCDARVDVQDIRNASDSGPYAEFDGDRLPNQPYLQASGSAYVRRYSVVAGGDFVELSWNVRRVGEFNRGWDSAGNDDIKLTIAGQTVQGLALAYVLERDETALSNSFEVQNLTNERVYDFYGVQRPGRSFFWKMTVDYK